MAHGRARRRTRSASLTADPNDPSGNTLYLGTGEANRCSSGCEAGVGIYKSTNGGNNWTKLADTCVSNATYACVTPGRRVPRARDRQDRCRPDEPEPHLRRLRTRRPRALAHDRQRRRRPAFAPGANNVGLYESTDGGKTFTEVWNGNGAGFRRQGRRSRSARSGDRVRVGVRPGSLAALADARRLGHADDFQPGLRTAGSPAAGPTARCSRRRSRTGKTRIYLTDGTANGSGTRPCRRSSGERTTPTNPPAALLASQAAGVDRAARPRESVPGDLQRLAAADVDDDVEPVLRDD